MDEGRSIAPFYWVGIQVWGTLRFRKHLGLVFLIWVAMKVGGRGWGRLVHWSLCEVRFGVFDAGSHESWGSGVGPISLLGLCEVCGCCREELEIDLWFFSFSETMMFCAAHFKMPLPLIHLNCHFQKSFKIHEVERAFVYRFKLSKANSTAISRGIGSPVF